METKTISNRRDQQMTPPVLEMAGIRFYADLENREFREVDAPWNKFPMEVADGVITEVPFDTLTRSVYLHIIDPERIPPHVKLVRFPAIRELENCATRQRKLLRRHRMKH